MHVFSFSYSADKPRWWQSTRFAWTNFQALFRHLQLKVSRMQQGGKDLCPIFWKAGASCSTQGWIRWTQWYALLYGNFACLHFGFTRYGEGFAPPMLGCLCWWILQPKPSHSLQFQKNHLLTQLVQTLHTSNHGKSDYAILRISDKSATLAYTWSNLSS